MGPARGLYDSLQAAGVQADTGNPFAFPDVEVLLEGIHVGIVGEAVPNIDGNGALVGTGTGSQQEGGDKAE